MGAAGASLCGVAALLAAPELYVAGLALALGATVAPIWVTIVARGCEVALSADATTVPEGESARLTVTVNRGRLPAPGSARLSCSGWNAPPARLERRAQVAVSATVARRGLHLLGPARLQISDPLGICAREVRSGELEVLGLPSVHAVRTRAPGPFLARSRGAGDGAQELDSLRPYRENAPASRIHWPTVARTGRLMERSLVAEADLRIVVLLDAHRPHSEQALEQALRATASLCVYLASRGGCALLLPGEPRPCAIGSDLGGWTALHARLALVEASVTPPPARRAVRGCMVLYVTAAADTGQLPGRCWRVGPCPIPDRPVRFTVAGCSGQLCPEVMSGARKR